MRSVIIEEIDNGMELAKTVFDSQDNVLFLSGHLFELKNLDTLKKNRINCVEVLEDKERSGKPEFLKHIINRLDNVFSSSIAEHRYTELFENEITLEPVKEVFSNIIDNEEILTNMSRLERVDDYTFIHSVNVCFLSLVTGFGMNMNQNDLLDLGKGALLHDIGKLKIPDRILKKPSSLLASEFGLMKKHTYYGRDILSDCKKIGIKSIMIALGHHERHDGSGYPLSLKGDAIDDSAKIVALADVYDALTSNRVYRVKLETEEIGRYMNSIGIRHFDNKIFKSFIKFIKL